MTIRLTRALALRTARRAVAGAGKYGALDRPEIFSRCIGERGVKRRQCHPQTDALGFTTQPLKRLYR